MPVPVPTMARIAASVTNIIFRFAERGDGGPCTGVSTRSRPPAVDLANNRLRFNFILPIGLQPHCSKFPVSAGLHLRHGYWPAAWTRRGPFGVRVWYQTGGEHGGTAVGGGAKIGPEG